MLRYPAFTLTILLITIAANLYLLAIVRKGFSRSKTMELFLGDSGSAGLLFPSDGGAGAANVNIVK